MACISKSHVLLLLLASLTAISAGPNEEANGPRVAWPDLRAKNQCTVESAHTLLAVTNGSCPLARQPEKATRQQPVIDATWKPWTAKPYCVSVDFCVYTNARFHEGHGISIIQSRQVMSHAAAAFESGFATPFLRGPAPDSDPPYDVLPVPGKGLGAIAKRRIRRGETIMVEYAAIMIDSDFLGEVHGEARARALETAIDRLPGRERVLSLSRRGVAGLAEAEDVVRTNTHGVTLDGRTYTALFPEIARMNHDCNPNAFPRFSQGSLAMVAAAFRDIEPGEEITASYLDQGLSHQQRQQAIHKKWGFSCTCAMCASPSDVIAASDRRRARIAAIRRGVIDEVRRRRFQRAIDMNLELLALAEEEGSLPDYLGDTYEVLAKLYHAVGDGKQAERYARLAFEALKVFGGPDRYDSVTTWQDLL